LAASGHQPASIRFAVTRRSDAGQIQFNRSQTMIVNYFELNADFLSRAPHGLLSHRRFRGLSSATGAKAKNDDEHR
jgi:hypothetical protein